MYFESETPQETPPATPGAGAAVTAADPFAAVPAVLHDALRRRGFAQLTTVQQTLLAADDGERDLRISSQTGSGKTVALGFALCRAITDRARRGPTTLIIAPTRELAAQVCEELAWLFADLDDVACEVVTGGTSVGRERMRLKKRPAVLVGTPGRLLDHIREGALDLSSVHQLVLDEADQMLDLGFKDELDGILAALPAERRTHLVSATFPRQVIELADRFQRDALLVRGQAHGQAHADIEHVALKIHAREHYPALVNLLLLAGEERTLVFVRTREDTTALADKLAADGFAALPISGDLAQAQRTRTLNAFKNGTVRTLIATDVAARGLDIQDVTSVVHVDPPVDAATYTHRSGRTGRAGQKGRSIMLVLKSHEGRSRRIYAQAKVTATWTTPPDVTTVQQRQMLRAEAVAMEAVAAHGIDDGQRRIAAHLLQGRDPVEVVAALLKQASAGPRAPFPFAAPMATAMPAPMPRPAVRTFAEEPTPAPRTPTPRARPAVAAPRATPTPAIEPAASVAAAVAAGSTAAEVDPAAPPIAHPAPAAERPHRTLAAEQRGRASAPPAWRRDEAPPRPGEQAGFTRFRINWGTRDGAEPRRILAHVCRRGDIDSRMVGAIQLHVTMSTFDVADDVAAAFGKRVQRRDRRDPNLVITRAFATRRAPAPRATPAAEAAAPAEVPEVAAGDDGSDVDSAEIEGGGEA